MGGESSQENVSEASKSISAFPNGCDALSIRSIQKQRVFSLSVICSSSLFIYLLTYVVGIFTLKKSMQMDFSCLKSKNLTVNMKGFKKRHNLLFLLIFSSFLPSLCPLVFCALSTNFLFFFPD